MVYYIESKNGPRSKWTRVAFAFGGYTRDKAIALASQMDEMGSGVVRVVSEDRSEIIKIS